MRLLIERLEQVYNLSWQQRRYWGTLPLFNFEPINIFLRQATNRKAALNEQSIKWSKAVEAELLESFPVAGLQQQKNFYKTFVNIHEMCFLYSRDSLNEIGRPYTLEQQRFLVQLFLEHINNHIERVGGYNKLKLYTIEEVAAIENKSTEDLFKAIEAYKKSRGY